MNDFNTILKDRMDTASRAHPKGFSIFAWMRSHTGFLQGGQGVSNLAHHDIALTAEEVKLVHRFGGRVVFKSISIDISPAPATGLGGAWDAHDR